ncbi:haloacid dehalogenase [bacterium]|nr:MAG: haloacid dehalogenase [bacterium]
MPAVGKLLCTDLDRTLLPNGDAPESPGVRQHFARAAVDGQWTLAYVSGRHLESMLDAIKEYELPQPHFAVCDVGTSIYRLEAGVGRSSWACMSSWEERMRTAWPDDARDRAAAALIGLGELQIQGPQAQTRSKLSYYAPALDEPEPLLQAIETLLAGCPGERQLVYSVDETSGTGLLDLLPAGSGKHAAVEHIMQQAGFGPEQVLFAGDSGNDLDVLASSIPSVLVANATGVVRAEALRRSRELGHESLLYLARGEADGMNGNYAAGILEGVGHFWPGQGGAT